MRAVTLDAEPAAPQITEVAAPRPAPRGPGPWAGT
jgi:hypothetical protein